MSVLARLYYRRPLELDAELEAQAGKLSDIYTTALPHDDRVTNDSIPHTPVSLERTLVVNSAGDLREEERNSDEADDTLVHRPPSYPQSVCEIQYSIEENGTVDANSRSTIACEMQLYGKDDGSDNGVGGGVVNPAFDLASDVTGNRSDAIAGQDAEYERAVQDDRINISPDLGLNFQRRRSEADGVENTVGEILGQSHVTTDGNQSHRKHTGGPGVS